MENIINNFNIYGSVVHYSRFGCGHINETYIVLCDSGLSYILQKLSPVAFKNPENLMYNVSLVCDFLSQRVSDSRECMHLIKTKDGKYYHVDNQKYYWRMYDFVSGSICLQRAESGEDLYKTAFTFGKFQKELADFPAVKLTQTIPNFHNTPDRYRLFKEALKRDKFNRADLCRDEIDFILSREKDAPLITNALANGDIPLRVTHNDTKLNNILLDYTTRKPLCVIDLDTVMPGSSLYDFGDIIRSGANTADEDEEDLTKVSLDMSLYNTALEGFVTGCGGMLNDTEIKMLPVGARLMTLECGVRFLTDYLNGDVYFRVHKDKHNLFRCRTQLKLIEDMERKI